MSPLQLCLAEGLLAGFELSSSLFSGSIKSLICKLFLKVHLLGIFAFAFYGNAQIMKIEAINDLVSLGEDVSLGESLPRWSRGSGAGGGEGGVLSSMGTLLPAEPSATQDPYLPTPQWPRRHPVVSVAIVLSPERRCSWDTKPREKQAPRLVCSSTFREAAGRCLLRVAKVRPVMDGIPVLPLS